MKESQINQLQEDGNPTSAGDTLVDRPIHPLIALIICKSL